MKRCVVFAQLICKLIFMQYFNIVAARYRLCASQISHAGLCILSDLLVSRGRPALSASAIDHAMRALPPCRFEHHSIAVSSDPSGCDSSAPRSKAVCVILDVGHNPPAFERLFQKLAERHPNRPVRVILGAFVH